MEVNVRYFGLVRNIVRKKEEKVDLPPGSSLRHLLQELEARYGEEFKRLVIDSQGDLASEAIVLLDGEDVRNRNQLDTKLDGGVEAHLVVLAPAALGGSS